tara:strand:- start:254 stop:3274 length:3021 start_codon:yes stop_codon:yes gene_type:complete
MTKFWSNITLEGANDIQFKNTAGANTGKIESDGNDLVLSNAVGDILLGDGASDVYIGDGTNNVDILFEQSGSIKAEDGSSGVTLTLGSSDTTLALGGAISLADAVSAISGTGVNTIDIGTSVKPFKNIYAAHHVGGSSINYATSRGWVEDDAPLSSTQVGEFGGNFVRNGAAAENAVVWGLDPFNNKALLWKAIMNTSDDNDDGGWNKQIVIPANNDIGYLSYVYFKVDFTANSSTQGSKDGTVYLGAGQVAGETINVSDGSNNTNPYFVSHSLTTMNNGGPAVANRWYLMVGVLQAYNNSTTDTDTVAGVYDVETGEKVLNGAEFKMGNNTTGQKHRAYIYYDQSTDNENAYFWNPGFHAIDGSEPKIQDLVKRQVYLDDNVKAAFGTGNDLEIYHDGSNSYISDTGTGNLSVLTNSFRLLNAAANENMIQATEDGAVTLYHNNAAKVTTVAAGVEITGELQADTLDIDGAADISGNLTVSNLTSSGYVKLGADDQLISDGSITVEIDYNNNQTDRFFKVRKDNSTDLFTISEDASATFAGNVTAGSNSLTAGSLDINGNADISGDLTGVDNITAGVHYVGGTSNYIDIATGLRLRSDSNGIRLMPNGTDVGYIKNTGIDLVKPLTVGVDDTGHDVIFYGATSGKKMQWDESADQLIVDGRLDMNGNVDISGDLVVNGDNVTFQSANADDPIVTIKNTSNDTNDMAQLKFVKDRGAAPAAGTNLAEIYFVGEDSAQNEQEYGRILCEIDVATGGQESGILKLGVANHDGGNGYGLSMTGGSANDEVDVTVALGAASVTTVSGTLTMGSTATLTNAGLLAVANQSNITGLGTISSGVWNGTAIATDQQKHLENFEFEGFSVGDGTNYMIPEINSDTKAPFEHQTSTGSDGLTATTVIRLLRTSGHVMPYAGTLKLWRGWMTSSGTGQTVDVGLYKVTLTNNSATDVSPVVLKNTSFTSVGNTKALTFAETSFGVAFAAGDILISAIRNGTNNKKCEFTSTLVVEWD